MNDRDGATTIVAGCDRDDMAGVVAILHDSYLTTWAPVVSPAAWADFLAERRIEQYVEACWAEFWVARRDAQVAGMIHWRDNTIHALHVHSSHRRTGVGTALLDFAEQTIASQAHSSVHLETDSFNDRSRAFYASRRYVEVGRGPDTTWNSGIETLRLEKPLQEPPTKLASLGRHLALSPRDAGS